MSSASRDAGSMEAERRQALIDRLEFLGQMASTETALFHQTAAAKFGLGITDMKTISVLLQEGPLTAGQLAKRLSLTTGAVTNVIDRLERRDIMKREPDETDRRKVVVVVQPEKIAEFNEVYNSMGEAFAKLLRTYSIEELEFLVRHDQMTIDLTMKEIAKLVKL
jgi:DNA-binding MarR family transcriptional regulator